MQLLPLHLDLFGLMILLGVAQGLFLGIFFLTGSRRNSVANRCLGWVMLSTSAIIAEILLCYSNYMFRAVGWTDFSEPLNFVVGPLFFLYVFARIKNRLPRHWVWHLLPLILWTINAVSWLYQPIELKYNNYINSWHPTLPQIPEPAAYLPEDFFCIRQYIDELTLVSFLIYNVLSFLVIRKAYRQLNNSFWQSTPAVLAQLRNLTVMFAIVPVVVLLIKPQFHEDLGDYLIACYLTAVIYGTSFLIMSGSDFFRQNVPEPAHNVPGAIESGGEPRRKYEKSSLSEDAEDDLLIRLNQLLETDKPHLDSTLSLPKLAAQVRISPHHLSQLLNDRLGQTFFDWLATHRVAEAQRLLTDPITADLKIDDIAERVGYNATSAFHTAFKRITSQTPAQFRDANRAIPGSSRSARSS